MKLKTDQNTFNATGYTVCESFRTSGDAISNVWVKSAEAIGRVGNSRTLHVEVCCAVAPSFFAFDNQSQRLLQKDLGGCLNDTHDVMNEILLPLPTLLVILVKLSEKPNTVFLTKLAAP